MPAVGEVYIPWRIFVGFVIPVAIARSTELSPSAKLVFGKLCQYAGENGLAYPSYKTLGYEVGIERRQAIRTVQELIAFGLIRPVGRVKENGGFTSNSYEFLWHQIFMGEVHPDSPGVGNDTKVGVTNVTTPQCHKRHPLVSEMTPKENHTRDKNIKKTTTEEIRLLLSDTPLFAISDKELKILLKRHDSERVKLAADIAAETWRPDKEAIRNPGGYLQALCEYLVVPEGYEPPHVRAANSKAAAERKRVEDEKQAELKKAEMQESKERDDYWHSLSEEDRQKHRDEFMANAPFLQDPKEDFLDGLAKLTAWDNRQQMNTNTSSSMETGR